MAHGYLSYQPVTGESPLADKLFKKIGDLVKKEGKKNAKKVLNGVKDLLKKDRDTSYRGAGAGRVEVTGKKQGPGGGMLPGSEPKGLLAGKGGLVKREDRELALGKNPTNIDRREQKILGPAGSTGRSRKGGTFTDMPGVSGGIADKTDKVFSKGAFNFSAIEAGIKSGDLTGRQIREMKRAAQAAEASGAPPITPDSGADIVAAVNRNTQAIVNLVDVTELQTKSDVNIAQQSIQAQETMFSRRAAKREEKALEEGEDLSSFVTPEKIMKAVKPKGQGGGGGDDKKGGGGFPGMGMAKGLLGKGKLAGLGKGAAIAAAIVVGLAGGISLGTHLGNQHNDRIRQKNKGKYDRLGNTLDKDGNVLAGPSLPSPDLKGPAISTEERWTADGTFAEADARAEQVSSDMQQQYNDLNPEAPIVPGFNQGGLVTGGKANKVDDVKIRADEGEVVMSNAAGNMFGRDSFLSMNALAGSTNTPSSGDGYAGGGLVGNKVKTKKLYELMGEGILDAQLNHKKEYADLQGEGLKNYFENKGGAEKLGEGLKGFFEGLGGLFSGAGGLFSGLFGGGQGTPGAGGLQGPSMSASEQQLTEALIAGEEGVRTKAYQDSEGIWTIGYGQTQINGRAVREGDEISKEEALTGFRGALAEHQQRAINQVGEKRWAEMDPKMRAVLSSLTYNYGSIPKRVLQAAKTGSVEDLANAMDSLHGDNDGDLKGRRQREQSILRGNMQGTAGNPLRLDQDFLAGGKFAGQGTGPSITLSSPGSPGSGSLASAAESLRGMSTRDGPGQGSVSCVYAVNKVFNKAGMTPPWGGAQDTLSAIRGMKAAGWQQVGFGEAQPGDVWVYDDGATKGHVGIKTTDGKVLSNSSSKASFTWAADQGELLSWYPKAGLTPPGGIFFRPPSTDSVTQPASPIAAAPLSAEQKSKMLQNSGMPALSANALTNATPGPVPATPAPGSSNTGTGIMATSAQVAMAGSAPAAAPTVINNYYGSGGDQGGTPVPNGVSPGIGMDRTGTEMFQDLRIRSLT